MINKKVKETSLWSRVNRILLIVPCICISIFFSSCNNEEKEKGEKLFNLAETIILDCESLSASHIESTIASIKSYLKEYQSSKKYDKYHELSNYIERLYSCLDFHKIREYTEKYEKLLGKVYYDVNSAIQEQDGFLDRFTSEYGSLLLVRQPQIKSYIEEIELIKNEFESMKSFFERKFSDLGSYNSEVRYNAYRFENSKYESVRKSWKEIANNQRSVQATIDMDKKVANFEQYLKEDAERICSYHYNDFVIDRNRDTQTISIGTPSEHDTYNAKVCEAIFRVYLEGAFIGWDKGSVRISVKGMICVTVDSNQTKSGVKYENMDFHILETTGDL